MVQVRRQTLTDAQGGIDFDQWLGQLPLALDDTGRQRMLEACHLVERAQQTPAKEVSDWARESNCLVAGLDIALVLADLHVDLDCMLAGILYRAVREGRLQREEIRSHFGNGVAELIGGVLRMAAIGQLPLQTDNPVLGQASTLR